MQVNNSNENLDANKGNITNVALLKNVPFNNYKHTRYFLDSIEQTKYFNKFIYEQDNTFKYQRVNINTIKVFKSVDDLLDVNYIMFQNSRYSKKWYYAFVTGHTYISSDVSEISYEIDVIQTFMFDFTFRPSYVDREHTKRFNSDGTPIINTIDEGLDYGSEYETIEISNHQQLNNVYWTIIVSSVDLNAYPLTYGGLPIGGVPTPLYFYAIPYRPTGARLTLNGQSLGSPSDFFKMYSTNSDLIGKIVSMFYTSYLPFNVSLSGNNVTCDGIDVKSVGGQNIGVIAGQSFETFEWNLGSKYSKLKRYSESKLMMYPYSLIEMTDFRGNNFTIKPEMIQDPNLIIKHKGSISTIPKNSLFVHKYNTNQPYTDISWGFINTEASDIPIIDDYTASYIQANKNQVGTQNRYIEDNASRGVRQATTTNRMMNAQMNMMQGKSGDTITDLYHGLQNFIGVGTSLFTGGNQQVNREWQRTNANQQNKFNVENINVDAEQQIGMLNAKMKDINNMPPTIGSMGNNEIFTLGNRYLGFYMIYKTIKTEYADRLSNYFKMFGYRVNELKIPSLRTRRDFNYIKTIGCEIKGSIPQMYINKIKTIFDDGITLWHNDDIYNYNLDNPEI